MLKTVRKTPFKTITAMGFCTRGERLASTPRTTRKSGDCQTRSRVKRETADGKLLRVG